MEFVSFVVNLVLLVEFVLLWEFYWWIVFFRLLMFSTNYKHFFYFADLMNCILYLCLEWVICLFIHLVILSTVWFFVVTIVSCFNLTFFRLLVAIAGYFECFIEKLACSIYFVLLCCSNFIKYHCIGSRFDFFDCTDALQR